MTDFPAPVPPPFTTFAAYTMALLLAGSIVLTLYGAY